MNQPAISQSSRKKTIVSILLFLAIALLGLAYVKWIPYYGKSMTAITTHSIGDSILGSPGELQSFSWHSASGYALAYFQSVWKAAVLGIVLGSLIQVLIPANWLMKVLGKSSFGSTAVAGLSALPGMMCTCCAAPVAVGLRKRNASIGASLAFWLGNPLLNPATLIFMTFVLSWKFTLLRVVFGVLLTFGVSYIANRLVPQKDHVELERIMNVVEEEDQAPFLSKWLKSLGTMIVYIVPAYILSVLLIGAVQGLLLPHIGNASGNVMILILLCALGGMLFVIPTAAEIPIIQTMMAFGLGGGPAGALLITLPAISLPSLLLVAKSFPAKVLLFVSGSVILAGVLSGLIGMWLF
ncbi:permease [Sporosarcina sp. Te-1]|uniref:permease n=1 Tax=Sporosarcina sp. Te-1 TaxID=2818390 RepID=UPI001FB11B35|nr:permease [Sporosarcina sp. Te-1]